MVDAALNIAAEQVIEYSAYGALLQRDGNRGPTAAPQNLYRTNEIDEFGRADCWVAVAVATDEQWAGLRDALGQPAWAMADELAHGGGPARPPRPDRRALCPIGARTRTGDEIVDALWDDGVPVGEGHAATPADRVPQLAARGFFEDVEHPVNRARRTAPCRSDSRGARAGAPHARAAARPAQPRGAAPNSG